MLKQLPLRWLMIPVLVSITYAGTTGKLAGTITDAATGDPLIGANVIINGTGLGAATSLEGQYVILNISPGKYDIRVSMIGYTTVLVQAVRVSIDLTTRYDISMTVEAIGGEEVVVTGTRPLVSRDLTSSEARISSDQLEAMPVTEIWDVLAIQSGVTQDAGGGIHIRGGRSSEVAYWVDGVSMTDVYDGGLAVAIENKAIQELQVISGTFNAEYGQAMSGIINMVTKDGGQEYRGSANMWVGGFYTQDPIYRGLDQLDLSTENNYQLSLSGPVPLFGDFISFYTSARKFRDDGHLKGVEAFNKYEEFIGLIILPDADLSTIPDDPESSYGYANEVPDGYEEFSYAGYQLAGKIVPFSWREKVTTNSKLTLKLTNRLKLRLNYITSDEEDLEYNHDNQLVPDSQIDRFTKGQDVGLNLTHTVSARTFYSIRGTRFSKDFEMHEFSTPLDSGYIDKNFLPHMQAFIRPSYSFNTYGINMQQFSRRSVTDVAKFDLTSQINPIHQIKFGVEWRQHQLVLDDYDIQDSSQTDSVFTIEIPPKKLDSFNRDYYDVRPQEFSVYFQDKIEHENVIFNIGIRWDLFDANGQIPTNPYDPYIGNPRNPTLDSLTIKELLAINWTPFADYYGDSTLIGARGWWTDTKVSHKISPRLGIAYPITDQGVIHFSFGHFFQIPTFNRLYDNPGYKVPESSGRFGIFPNPALRPQKTVMYELGMNQAFMDLWTVDITGFYRDVRDWVSTGIPVDLGGGASYFTYVNKDYSNVRGVTLNVERRMRGMFAVNLNYTFQVAEGSNSDPGDEYGAAERGEEPIRAIIPLDWDQTHTANGTLFFGTSSWGGTLLGRFGSGYPYSPENVFSATSGQSVDVALDQNSRRKPFSITLDMKLFYQVPVIGANAQVFLNVYNLFDRRNENTVYGNTGRTNRSLLAPDDDAPAYASPLRPNLISEFFNRPDWYSVPRHIQVGFNVSF